MSKKPKKSRDSLGDRMKRYEASVGSVLIQRMPVIIRLDGKAFHTLTRGLNKPFDNGFISAMDETMIYLVNNIQNCVMGYVQSDEITLLLIDDFKYDTHQWFGGKVQKICSVAASMATMYFNQINSLGVNNAMFDARCFNIPKEDVVNNFIWRQNDCIRNSILAYAQSIMSHKDMQGKSCKQLVEELKEQGYDWNEINERYQYGDYTMKNLNVLHKIFQHSKDGNIANNYLFAEMRNILEEEFLGGTKDE